MKVGVLAIQGGVVEHVRILEKLNAKPVLVRTKPELKGIEGLVMPGGESTAIGLELKRSGLGVEIKNLIQQGLPVLGTCAGAILLAKSVADKPKFTFDIAEIEVVRNNYGRQIDSFEAKIKVEGLKESMNAIFIRAPIIKRVGAGWKILARWAGDPVLIRKDNIIICTFHPELAGDDRVHRMLIDSIRQ